jgi:hypothetical protein
MIPGMRPTFPARLPLAAAAAVVLAAMALGAGCVPAEPTPKNRARAAPRDISPSRVTLMLLESRDTDFDLSPDTFVLDVVLFNEFESPLPVRPPGRMQFSLIGAGGEELATWNVDQETLRRVQRTTALGLDGYRMSLSLREAGVEDDIPPQGARIRARFIPVQGGPASGETPVRLGLSQ